MRRENSEAEPNTDQDLDQEGPGDSQATVTVMHQVPAEGNLVGTQASQAFPSSQPMPALPAAEYPAPVTTAHVNAHPDKPKHPKPAKALNILEVG